ncbi:beta-ketoacyl-ACP synthase III [Alkalibacterium sp.]
MNNLAKIRILSTGRYIPKRRVLNQELTEWMDTSDDWIKKRTGIQSRYLSTGEETSDLCSKAADKIVSNGGVRVEDIGLIIVATMSPDSQSPSVASKVQAHLGAVNAVAFDLNAACSGFIYALSAAEKMLRHMSHSHALVIGGEVMSKVVDWNDRKTAVLFGDGAGGVMLERNSDTEHFISEDLKTDGTRGEALVSGLSTVSNPIFEGETANGFLTMDGREIFNFVIKSIPMSIQSVMADQKLTVDDIDQFILHQANARIIESVSKKIKCPIEKFPMNIQHYGNTSAASIPILLDELNEQNKLFTDKKQKLILSAFGGGLTWGTLLLEIN